LVVERIGKAVRNVLSGVLKFKGGLNSAGLWRRRL